MSQYYEVPFDSSTSFSTTFPPQLAKVIDQLTYIQTIEAINRSIQQVPYSASFKLFIALSLATSVILTVDPTLSLYSSEYSALCLLIAPIVYLIGGVYQSYARRKPLQEALEAVNETINQSNNQVPVSIRLYHPPLKHDRLRAGADLNDNSIEESIEPIHVGNVSLFAGRNLYVEVGFDSSTKQPPKVLAVDIPINLSVLGSSFGCDYDPIYPAPIAHAVDRQTFNQMITSINQSMHDVTISRPLFVITISMLITGLVMLLDVRLDRYSHIAKIGVALLAISMLLACYVALSHMSNIVEAAKLAIKQSNDEFSSKTPRLQLLALGEPPYAGGLHGSNMHLDYAFKANELMLVLGQPVIEHSNTIDIQ